MEKSESDDDQRREIEKVIRGHERDSAPGFVCMETEEAAEDGRDGPHGVEDEEYEQVKEKRAGQSAMESEIQYDEFLKSMRPSLVTAIWTCMTEEDMMKVNTERRLLADSDSNTDSNTDAMRDRGQPCLNRTQQTSGTDQQKQDRIVSLSEERILKIQRERKWNLRHANKCTDDYCVVTPHCAKAKRMLEHIKSCESRTCKISNCVSSRYIIFHYYRCRRDCCLLCIPVREAIRIARSDAPVNSAADLSQSVEKVAIQRNVEKVQNLLAGLQK